MSQIAAGQAGVVYDGAGYSSSTTSFPYPAAGNGTPSPPAPKAYLNWIVFDRNFVQKTFGYTRITSASREYGQDVAHEQLSSPSITITEAGYVYIYLSNEETTPIEVYFDDFKVTNTKSPVVQVDEYYPFGLTFNSYSRENGISQDYKYNGKELQDELGVGWLDYGARMFQPEIGRFFAQDRFSEKYTSLTPYQYGANSPILFVDINGDSLIINGSSAAKAEFIDIVNRGTGGSFSASIGKDGLVSLSADDTEREMTDSEKAFYAIMSEAASLETGASKFDVVNHDDSKSSDVLVGDNGTHPQSANPGTHTIDVGDVAEFGRGKLKEHGALAHEIVEGRNIQLNNKTGDQAHAQGLRAEGTVSGVTIVSPGAALNSSQTRMTISVQQGKAGATTISTIEVKLKNGNISSIKGN